MSPQPGLASEISQRDLLDSLAARQFFANRLEAHFRAHPLVWISILELIEIGGPSWRSRIANDLRGKRKMCVPWNRSNTQSAYMFRPDGPALGRDASVPAPDRWPAFDAPYTEPWSLT